MGVFNPLRLIGFGIGTIDGWVRRVGRPHRLLGTEIGGYDPVFYMATLGALIGAAMVALLVRQVREPAHPTEDIAATTSEWT